MYQKIVEFFKESRQELRKVTWPGRKEVTASTGVVVVIVIIFVLLIMVVDWLIGLGMAQFYKI